MKYPLDLRRRGLLAITCALVHGSVACAAGKAASTPDVARASAAKVAQADASSDARTNADAVAEPASEVPTRIQARAAVRRAMSPI
jgi:hypothetical protein